jgi:hypothetical protein
MMQLPLSPIPSADPLPQPAPSWLLWGLLLATFLLHLVAMNLVMGGSVLGAFAAWRARRGDHPHHRRLVQWLSRVMPIALAATINFGVAPLLFLQVLYGRLFFTSSVLLGWFWFAVIPLILVAYSSTYLLAFKGEKLGAWEGVLRVFTIVNLLAIAFLFSNNMSLMLRPDLFRALYASGVPRLNIGDPTLWPRFGHMVMGSLAVGSMWVAGYGLWKSRHDLEFGNWAMRYGAAWFSSITAVNILFGFWFLFSLPATTMARFMGDVPLAASLLALGMFFGLGSMSIMFMAANSPQPAPMVKMGMAALVLTLLCMVLIRDQVRRGALALSGYDPVTWVAPQWGNIAVFAVLLLAGVATVIWMVRALLRGSDENQHGRLPGNGT